ncbi:MAG: ferrochelatase [Hyphomicrobiales bacterium]|nr:ferrochelatase [Hyphomicrobiales bacterium]
MEFESENREGVSPLPEQHVQVASGRIGVLLINLGTPDATDYWSMRRYLKEFLSDRRVVEANRLVWWLVLNGIVLSKRPRKSGRAYQQIWDKKRDESPLKTITRSQSEILAEHYHTNKAIEVSWAMRYGSPKIAEQISNLKSSGCDQILLFPLYPQYSAATTATALDKTFEALQSMRWQPAIRTVPPYFEEPEYIAALADSIRQHIETLAWKPEVVLASFHGLPEEFLTRGDPYYCHCQKTARLLKQRLNFSENELIPTFQSRSGRAKWLQPYTDETIENLARDGVKNLLVVTPGFAADCLETLEEIEIRGAKLFHKSGGENFSMVPCLNDSAGSVGMLRSIIDRELQGWV